MPRRNARRARGRELEGIAMTQNDAHCDSVGRVPQGKAMRLRTGRTPGRTSGRTDGRADGGAKRTSFVEASKTAFKFLPCKPFGETAPVRGIAEMSGFVRFLSALGPVAWIDGAKSSVRRRTRRRAARQLLLASGVQSATIRPHPPCRGP